MEAGCYSLHLYCDQITPDESRGIDTNPNHSWDEFPHEYIGETRANCVRKARRDGWIFHRDRTHTCPRCYYATRKIMEVGGSE